MRLGHPGSLLHCDVQTRIWYEFLILPTRATCSSHLIFSDLITLSTSYDTPDMCWFHS